MRSRFRAHLNAALRSAWKGQFVGGFCQLFGGERSVLGFPRVEKVGQRLVAQFACRGVHCAIVRLSGTSDNCATGRPQALAQLGEAALEVLLVHDRYEGDLGIQVHERRFGDHRNVRGIGKVEEDERGSNSILSMQRIADSLSV